MYYSGSIVLQGKNAEVPRRTKLKPCDHYQNDVSSDRCTQYLYLKIKQKIVIQIS